MTKRLFLFALSLFLAITIYAQGTYALSAGDAPHAGTTITSVPGIKMTYGTADGTIWRGAIEDYHVPGFYAYSLGNEVNPSPYDGEVPTSGCFYLFEVEKAGTLSVAVYLNGGKKLYILEDGTVLPDFNGKSYNNKYYGTFDINVKAGSTYHVYASNSKLGFYGFKFETDDNNDEEQPGDDPGNDNTDTETLTSMIGLSPYDANAPLGWGKGTTGSNDKNPVVVTTQKELEKAIEGSDARTIYIKGNITVNKMLTVGSNKTIYGYPESSLENPNRNTSAGIFNLGSSNNVIIRNVTFLGPGAYDIDGNDNITLSGATNIWIDHCDIQDGMDGNMDIVNGSDNISVTWTRFRYLIEPLAGGSGGSADHRNCNLIGNNDNSYVDKDKLRVTFVNCWWDEGCHERCPRVRYGKVHVANCLYSGNDFAYCIGYGYLSNIYAENCAFTSTKAKNNYIKAYNNSGDFNITVTGCQGVSDTEKHKGNNTQFLPSDHYQFDIYDAAYVESAVSDPDYGAGATLQFKTTDDPTDGISPAHVTFGKPNIASIRYFTLDGRSLSQPQKGLNIIRYQTSDGTFRTQKTFIK